jgi:hypothetical protein
MNKKDLLAALEDTHERLTEAIASLSEEEMLLPGTMGDWSVKDLLAHLSRWEAELVKLLWQARQGLQPSTILNSPISFDEINARWQQEDQDRPLKRILEDFHGVREQTMRRLESFEDKDLDNPQRFPWLKGRELWTWVASDSYEHDLEHLPQLLNWLDQRKGK